MIIKIAQTASNIKQTHDIEGDNFYYQGEAGSFSKYQPIILSNPQNTVKGIFRLSNWVNYIPFRYLFGQENLTQRFQLYRNGNIYGSIAFSKHGFYKSYYSIEFDNGKLLRCYCRSKGSFNYVSVYHEDRQIALIETLLSTNDYKYNHKLYLLDEYSYLADTLSFFVLYYSNFNFAKRFHMSKSSTYVKSWSFSKYNDKYDPNWRETNFPDDNFFGKTHLFG